MAKCRTAICNIRKIKQIRIFIDTKTATTLASSLVLSHLDYSNRVLCGLPDNTIRKLQRVQIWAAKVILCRSKYDSSSGALLALHWLPIRQRIDFKILCLVFKCIHKTAPTYLSDLIQIRSFARNTRSSNSDNIILTVPFTRRSTFAQRSFSVYGPRVWNSLPGSIQNIDNYLTFKSKLKTFLFQSI